MLTVAGLSAFAARKALQNIESSQRALKPHEEAEEANTPETISLSKFENAAVPSQNRKSDGNASQDLRDSELNINSIHQPQLGEDDPFSYVHQFRFAGLSWISSNKQYSLESPAEPSEIPADKPPPALSSLKPSKSNLTELSNGALHVRLAPGEVLCFLTFTGRIRLISIATSYPWPIQAAY